MKNLLKRTSRILIAIAAVVLIQSQSLGVIIVSNLAESNGGSGTTGSEQWWAQGFQMPNDSAYTLDSVSLKLAKDTSAPNLGTFTVSLWNASGLNTPPTTELAVISSGTLVSSLTADPLYTDYTFTPSSQVALAQNGSYFVVLSASATRSDAGLQWGDTFSSSFTGTGQRGGWTGSVDGGTSWDPFVSNEFPYQFAVAATPVPEPEFSALASGLALLAFATLRRKWLSKREKIGEDRLE